MEILSFTKYLILQGFGFLVALAFGGIFIFLVFRRLHTLRVAIFLSVVFFGVVLFVFAPRAFPTQLAYPFWLTTYGPSDGPELPLKNIFTFFRNIKSFERVMDIARDPDDLPPPITRERPEEVLTTITAKEVISEVAPGVLLNYWTFDGRVPGPFLRVREGDTVYLTLKNDPANIHHHSIDLHAVTGPGGGATVTSVAPGESKILVFKTLNPGLYVYHCAHPNVANHMAHGMYGLILVEPEGGLPKVDKELYIVQGELYPGGLMGGKGLQVMSAEKLLNGHPEYVVFNGRVGGVGNMEARVGDRVRVYVGNGGVNLISSFHLIGEIFDTVYPEASMGGALLKNVQTTLVPAGGAAIVEFTFDVPGNYIFVDHALSRLDRGAWGAIKVAGPENRKVFDGIADPNSSAHGH